MLPDKLIPKKFLTMGKVCGVEIVQDEQGLRFQYSILKKEKNKINLVETGACEDQLTLPKQVIKEKIPVVIIVSGKSVLIKKVGLDAADSTDASILIADHLPGVNKEDFVFQILLQKNGAAFIAMLRKEQLQNILTQLDPELKIADVFLGPLVIGEVLFLVENYNSIQTNSNTVHLESGSITGISNGHETRVSPFKVEDIELKAENTLSFSSAFYYLCGANKSLYDLHLPNYLEEHKKQNKLKFSAYCLIGLALFFSLINFLFYTYYFDKSNKLGSELNVYQGKYDKINELLQEYEKKKDLIEQSGFTDQSSFSLYADKIAGTVPEQVVLSEFVFDPPKKDNEEDSLLVFTKKQVIIKGNCSKSLIVNEWINVLKAQNFIKDVNLEKFAFNSDIQGPNFEIRIVTE